MELFEEIKDVICGFPLAEGVRRKLLEHLYGVLGSTLPADGRAVVLRAMRWVPAGAAGTALVAGLAAASAEMRAAGVDAGVYGAWAGEWCARDIDASLVSAICGWVFCANRPAEGVSAGRGKGVMGAHVLRMPYIGIV